MALPRLLEHLQKWDQTKAKPKINFLFATAPDVSMSLDLQIELTAFAQALLLQMFHKDDLHLCTQKLIDRIDELYNLILTLDNKPKYFLHQRCAKIKIELATSFTNAIIQAFNEISDEEIKSLYLSYLKITYSNSEKIEKKYKKFSLDKIALKNIMKMHLLRFKEHACKSFETCFKSGLWDESLLKTKKIQYQLLTEKIKDNNGQEDSLELAELRFKYQIEFIIQALYQIEFDYLELGHRIRLSEIKKIIQEVEKKFLAVDVSYEEKRDYALEQIAQAFNKEKHFFLYRYFTRNRNEFEFVKQMNRSGDDYVHLLILTRKKLAAEIEDFPEVPVDSLMSQIYGIPKKDIFERYLDALETKEFVNYYQRVRRLGLSKIGAYRLFTKIDPISPCLIKKLSPDCKELFITPAQWDLLLHSNNREQFKKAAGANDYTAEILDKIFDIIEVLQNEPLKSLDKV